MKTTYLILASATLLASLASAALPPKPAKPPAASAQPVPVARWTFDKEANGAFPSTGRGIALKKPAGVEIVGGRVGSALQFGRESTGGAEIEQSMGDLVGDQFTVMFWILQEKEEISTNGYEALFDAGGRAGLVIQTQQRNLIDLTQGGMWHYLGTGKRFNLGAGWTQIAYTFDGDKSVLYVNGERFERPESELGPGKPPKFGPKMIVGSNSFNGMIDDLRIYDSALTAEQIAAAESE
jgi:hypothetical protein